MTDTRFSITKLNNKNYQIWKHKVELLLIRDDLWHTVGEAKPENPDERWLKTDKQARATIGLLVEDDQLRHIKNATSAQEAWNALKGYHQKASLTSQVYLFKRLCNMKLMENGDMEIHINHMLNVVDELAALGEELKDKLIIAMLLSSLPESYSTLVTALETRAEDELTLQLIKGKLIDEDRRRKNVRSHEEKLEDQALKASHKQSAQQKQVQKSQEVSCFFCKKRGHMKKDCTKYKHWKASKERANTISNKDKNLEICFVISNHDATNRKGWYIDSGATSHMTSDRNFFKNLNDCENEKLRLANGDCVEIHGIGEGTIICQDDKGKCTNITVKDVLFVPSLEESLISVKRLTEKGIQVKFEERKCNIIHESTVIAVAELNGNLYKLKSNNKVLAVVKEHNKDCQHQWHRRLGHRDVEAIKDMSNKGVIKGVQIKDCGIREMCETCLKGKLTRSPFPKKSTHQSKAILDLVHTDVCGPMQTITPGKKRYLLTMIDDYSRYTVVYLMANKSEVPDKIQEYIQSVKTKFNTVPKIIRSDKGKEYVNHRLQELFKKEGIETQYTVTYAPEQNGTAERKNRSLLEMARCLLIDASLPNKYWGEAVNTANHLQNRLVTKATGTTPIERWNGTTPNLKDMAIFGSKVYAHIPKELRRKLDVKARELRFMCFADDAKGFRLLDPATDRIITSRDVKFLNRYDCAQHEMEESSDASCKENQSKIEITLPNMIEEESQILNHDDDDRVDIPDNEDEDDISVESKNTFVKRGPGRPKVIRTGSRGRPKKDYHVQEIATQEVGMFAEVPVKEAITGSAMDEWYTAMIAELRSIIKNDVWILVNRPDDRHVVGSRMILTNKYQPDGCIQKRKARIVARGFSQRPGLDFNETFAPVARLSSIRLVIAIAAHYNMHVHQCDITTAYLNSSIKEEVYMEIPEQLPEVLEKLIGVENKSDIKLKAVEMLNELRTGNKVCKLQKALYGLKQAGREWYARLDTELRRYNATASNADPCVYYKGQGEAILLIVIYVDDIIIISANVSKIQKFKEYLNQAFEIKDLGEIKYCLGIEFSRKHDSIIISQKSYIKNLIEKFNMTDAKPVKTPMEPNLKLLKPEKHQENENITYRELIGCLMYLAVTTRPDIAYAISFLSQFNNNHGTEHWAAAKRVLRYLKGSIDLCLVYKSSQDNLKGYVDADWGSCVNDRHSYTGFVFSFSQGPITWESRKQRTVALSSAEAEYMGLTEATKEAIYLKGFFDELGLKKFSNITIFNDSTSAQKLAKNPIFHGRTKHIAIKHHFVREALKENLISVEYLCTTDMTADILTKALPASKHLKCVQLLGLMT